MSILQDAQDRAGTHHEAARAQRRIEWTPTASAVSLKRQGRAFQILDRLRQGPARTWDLMMLGGAGFSSRIRELRVSGFQIECTQDEDGAVYRLISS